MYSFPIFSNLTLLATRDLADLVSKKALTRTGVRKHTRYWLNVEVAN